MSLRMCTLPDRGTGRDRVKEIWLKLCECEARVKFWGDMVCLEVKECYKERMK